MDLGGEKMKEIFMIKEASVQQSGTNTFVNLPSEVRSILKPKKQDKIEFVIHSDRSIEIRMKEVK